MAPILPISLSPHVCILASQDLVDLLERSSLPQLPHVLQSFSPLPQVTTRTTSLTSVQHSSFALRFSDLLEVEIASKEDEERRAVRTLDWIAERIQKRCPKWVEDMEKVADREIPRTPWWDELKRCAEGDTTPSKAEAWNHPVAVILAVSTTAPNPLQAVTALHARHAELPSWVDSTYLRYTLIVHPRDSTLSDEEAGALYNAVKKQFGLTSYLLPLSLPSPPPPPVPVPALLPRLPPLTLVDSPKTTEFNSPLIPSLSPTSPSSGRLPLDPTNTIKMCESDIQQIGKFVREFLVMNLLPWMEKCVIEWNENFSSTRRLPSRLFSSTRRLFGSSPSPSPTHTTTSSMSSLPLRSQSISVAASSMHSPPSQQRRLAEFATILGDIKLAVTVWENLRKESKGASDILPLLLSPSPATQLHVSNALANIQVPSMDPPPHAQLRALLYAARWEGTIPPADFIGDILEGERWLVWAAGSAEELPSALLLGHAALLSSKKSCKRRAALWYSSAAMRLEKCGVKPLTMYFLRRAHELSRTRPQKNLSPSFWESEGILLQESPGFSMIMAGIEHPLGRLLYTTGDVASAVRLLLGLLKDDSRYSITPANGFPESTSGNDKFYLDDFRVAFNHFQTMSEDRSLLSDLKPSFSVCVPRKTTVRLGTNLTGGETWQSHEDSWRNFRKSYGGQEKLLSEETALVDEIFWVDVVLKNPLDTELALSNFTLTIHDTSGSAADYLDVESLDAIILEPKEQRTVPLSVKSSKAASLVITHATYNFLSLFPCSESLSFRGRRLHDTLAQRVQPTYAPDVATKVQVIEKTHRLVVNFIDDGYLTLAQGETRAMTLWISNEGIAPVNELWMVVSPEDEVWVSVEDQAGGTALPLESFASPNSLQQPIPWKLPIFNERGENFLSRSDVMKLPVLFHANGLGGQELRLMFTYRSDDSQAFHVARVSRSYQVLRLLDIRATAQPAPLLDHSFSVVLDIENASLSAVEISQISLLSPLWWCKPDIPNSLPILLPHQVSHLTFGADQWTEGWGAQETLNFVSDTITDILQGRPPNTSKLPPPLNLICAHVVETGREPHSVLSNSDKHFIHAGRRNAVVRSLLRTHAHIPRSSLPHIFPLYNPHALDFIIYWDLPSQKRSGHVYVSGLTIGAQHAALSATIEEARGVKVKRNMYAETERERTEIFRAIELSEWNMEMNPMTLVVQSTDMLSHDFSKGPLSTRVSFVLRNHSLTNGVRYTLRLQSPPQHADLALHSLPPPYTGRSTFRGTLRANETNTVKPCLWITRPGIYNLAGWVLETEILEAMGDTTGQRYIQEAVPGDGVVLVIRDVSQS